MIPRRLRVVENGAKLLEVARPQQMIDVDIGLLGQRPDRLAVDDHDLATADVLNAHAVIGEAGDAELAVGGVVLAEREQRRVVIGGERMGDGGVHGVRPTRVANSSLSRLSANNSSRRLRSP